MGGILSVFAVRIAGGSTEIIVEDSTGAVSAAAMEEPMTPIHLRLKRLSNYCEHGGRSPEITIGRFRVSEMPHEPTPF